MQKGKLIVIDGIDGSGKTTQIALLAKKLKEKKIPHEIISFPRYKDNIYGKLVKRYLEGEFGSIAQVNPYLMALAYAGDRALAKGQIRKWLAERKLVIANRYVSSSKAHMGANLPKKSRERFFKWLDELEYQANDLPKADLTILLNIDPATGQENVEGRADIHEGDLRHLDQASKIYLALAKRENSWRVVNCMDNSRMRLPQDIHQELINLI